nr:MAG TPA: hypothetical protein [Herelleviridae sp.]
MHPSPVSITRPQRQRKEGDHRETASSCQSSTNIDR